MSGDLRPNGATLRGNEAHNTIFARVLKNAGAGSCIRRLFIILIIAAFCFGSPMFVSASESLFSDVTDPAKYYYAPVYWGQENGIVMGFSDGTFRPDANCTRGQAVTFLWRLAGKPAPKGKSSRFTDVKETDSYFKAVLWGTEKGIVTGYADGTFRPGAVCKREHVVTFLWRLAGKPEPKSGTAKFSDVRSDAYYYKAVLWAAGKKITYGYKDGTFRPADDCHREHLVTFIYRFASVEENFYVSKITDSIFQRIKGKSYKSNCTVAREDLRYLHVLHVDIDGKIHEGEMICNARIANDVMEILTELYRQRYPIEKMRLVDEYDADDEKSMEDNNSSCFNFRFISHTTKVSKHGLGMAVDINPLYNPYIKTVNGRRVVEPVTAGAYTDRSKEFAYKINRNDLCCRLFREHGFTWGGDWSSMKDYQHFEK